LKRNPEVVSVTASLAMIAGLSLSVLGLWSVPQAPSLALLGSLVAVAGAALQIINVHRVTHRVGAVKRAQKLNATNS
jgi:hypothetical protein